jgi:hypothetical protein
MKRVIFAFPAGVIVLALALLAAGLMGAVGDSGTALANLHQCQSPADCNDDNSCTQDICTDDWFCWNPPVEDGTPCGDAIGYECQNGECVSVGPPPVPETHTYGLHLEVDLNCPPGSEPASLDGWITILHDFDTLADGNTNGREEIDKEIVSMELTGSSMLLGPVTVTLRSPSKHPFLPSTGEVEEQVNQHWGRLDVGPFAVGTADTFFDVFFELQAPDVGVVLHNDAPLLMTAVISDLLGSATYEGEAGALPLRDEQENLIGCDVSNLTASASPAGVGGMVELFVDGSGSPPSAAQGSGSSAPLYGAIAGAAAAAAVALAASGWYASRRWVR